MEGFVGTASVSIGCGRLSVCANRRIAKRGSSRRMNVRCEMEDPDGERLMMSSMYGDASKVKSLVDGGVNVDYVSTGSGMTALMWAASEGHVDVSKILIDAGANVNAVNQAGFTPLAYAFDGAPQVRPPPPPPAGFPGMPGKAKPQQMKFAQRIDSGHMGVAKLLLVSQADRNAVNPTTGDSLLHLATKRGYPKMVELLLDLGLPVDVRNPGYLHTPLHEAAMSNNPEIVTLLLSRGASINAQNRLGWTPLIWAAARGHLKAVEVLCKSGADISIRGGSQPGEESTDALKEANKALDNRSEILSVLRKYGAR
ncbi:hypothetical protein NDN08_001121 [Rhodosorus marinus]|uniref:Uncharacterized protein n=1 Tax=Rhodosorus marinus TaxID=101924 RepID=A0AAV8USN6_9RHOD|nr:hypothetical protein NDN08_001121 [Rhodosorus marinus]